MFGRDWQLAMRVYYVQKLHLISLLSLKYNEVLVQVLFVPLRFFQSSFFSKYLAHRSVSSRVPPNAFREFRLLALTIPLLPVNYIASYSSSNSNVLYLFIGNYPRFSIPAFLKTTSWSAVFLNLFFHEFTVDRQNCICNIWK